MRYTVTIIASTGTVTAEVDHDHEVLSLVEMVSNGAQVRHDFKVWVTDNVTLNSISLDLRTCAGSASAMRLAMDSLAAMQPRPRDPNAMRDVVVRVDFAVDPSTTLVDAEDFVRGAVQQAIDDHVMEVRNRLTDPSFVYNGDPVTQGAAKFN